MQKNSIYKKKKALNLKFMLNIADSQMLNYYAKLNNLSPKMAAKKIVHEFLINNVKIPEDEASNQLDLFTSRETNIFDYTGEE